LRSAGTELKPSTCCRVIPDNIINLSETQNLVTVMWANEQFDPDKPDTFFEEV